VVYQAHCALRDWPKISTARPQELGVIFIRCQDPNVRKTYGGPAWWWKALMTLLGEEVEIRRPGPGRSGHGHGAGHQALGIDIKKKEEAEKKEEAKKSDALPVPVDVIRASDWYQLGLSPGSRTAGPTFSTNTDSRTAILSAFPYETPPYRHLLRPVAFVAP
jgi:hypothetical protein